MRSEQLQWLTETARGTLMGDLLRRFWQPVALSREIAPGKSPTPSPLPSANDFG